MTHTNGQAKYKDLCFTFDDLQAAFCSGYTKGYNDSDSNEERTVSPIEGQLSVSEIVKRRKNLPATAPANGEEWEESLYRKLEKLARRLNKPTALIDKYPDPITETVNEFIEDVRTLKLKWEEAERERACRIVEGLKKVTESDGKVNPAFARGFREKEDRINYAIEQALASIAEGGGK